VDMTDDSGRVEARDDETAARIKAECMSGDYETDHCDADEILCQLLDSLGYKKTAAAWAEVGKWYA
jgi:hypothetical protein